MLNFERQTEILEILGTEKCCTVEALARRLFASPATIRRDLTEMEKKGQLTRVHGGAALNTGSNAEAPLLLRSKKEPEKKRQISELALPFLSDCKTVFMDSSSTVTAFAQLMSGHRGLSITTNGMQTAQILHERTNSQVYLTGGLLAGNLSLVGRAALATLSQMSADILFFSCCGFTAEGTWEASEENAMIKSAMAQRAKKVVLLCDSTKFEHPFFWSAVPVDRVDYIVTDKIPKPDILALCAHKLVCPKEK